MGQLRGVHERKVWCNKIICNASINELGVPFYTPARWVKASYTQGVRGLFSSFFPSYANRQATARWSRCYLCWVTILRRHLYPSLARTRNHIDRYRDRYFEPNSYNTSLNIILCIKYIYIYIYIYILYIIYIIYYTG